MAGNRRRLLLLFVMAVMLLVEGTQVAAEEGSTLKDPDPDPTKGPNEVSIEPFDQSLIMLKIRRIQEELHELNASAPLQPEDCLPAREGEVRVEEDDSPTERLSKMKYLLYDVLYEHYNAKKSSDPNADCDNETKVEVGINQINMDDLQRNGKSKRKDDIKITAETNVYSKDADKTICRTEGHIKYYCPKGDYCCNDNLSCCSYESQSSDQNDLRWRTTTGELVLMGGSVVLMVVVMFADFKKCFKKKRSDKKDRERSGLVI